MSQKDIENLIAIKKRMNAKVRFYEPLSGRLPENSTIIIIEDIPEKYTGKDIWNYFKCFGFVYSLGIYSEQEDGKSLRSAYLKFIWKEEAENALKYNRFNELNHESCQMKIIKPESAVEETQQLYNNLIIKDIPKNWTPTTLKKIFEKFGKIISCTILKDEKGESIGVGYCNFVSHESAKTALKEMYNYQASKSQNIKIFVAVSKQQRKQFVKTQREIDRQELVLYVDNLDERVTEDMLKKLLEDVGRIERCKIIRNECNRNGCYGFIKFFDHKKADVALSLLNNSVLFERSLMVSYNKKIENRHSLFSGQNKKQGSSIFCLPPEVPGYTLPQMPVLIPKFKRC